MSSKDRIFTSSRLNSARMNVLMASSSIFGFLYLSVRTGIFVRLRMPLSGVSTKMYCTPSAVKMSLSYTGGRARGASP